MGEVESRGYMNRAEREDWRTPVEVVQVVRAALGEEIELDPCASPDPAHHFATRNIHPPQNGLDIPWAPGPFFVNPPFGSMSAWAEKCHLAWVLAGTEGILLLPARTDTRYWHNLIAPSAAALCFWRGRLTFEGAPNVAPFPVVFAFWGPREAIWARFGPAFSPYGQVVVL